MAKKIDDYHSLPDFERKELPTFIKSYDEDEGLVVHFIAILGNTDSIGDRIVPNAFKKTILERKDRIKVLDQHNMDSVTRIVGKPIELREVGRDELTTDVLKYAPDATGGLLATTQYAIKTSRGADVFNLIKGGFAPESSIGYDPIQVEHIKEKGEDGEEQDIRLLKQIRLWEYSNVIFGCNNATAVVGAKADDPADAKADPPPSEFKPEPEVTENTIRIRVRDPGDFEDDSFRTINIGASTQGIKATVGRLKGENTMTIQSYVFDKEKWTVEDAQAWVDEHKKDDVPELDEKQATEDDAAADASTEDDAKEVEVSKADAPAEEQDKTDDPDEEQGEATDPETETKEPPEAVVFASVVLQDTLAKLDADTWEYRAAELALSKLRGLYGDEVDVVELEEKAGRVLAGRNAQRIGQALSSLISVLEDAGIDIPGIGEKPEPESEDEEEGKDYSLEIETAAAELDLFELEH